MSEAETGVTALAYQPPTIEIAGKQYQLRRLGILDTLRLARILAAGVAGLGTEIGNLDKMDPQVLGMVLLAGAPFAEKQTLEFLASCIGEPWEALKDPERFPMGAEVQIIGALIEHEDVLSFFDRLRVAVKAPGLRSLFRTSSTSSKRGTGGQTETSSPSPTPGSSKPPKPQRVGKGKRDEKN